MRYSLLGSTLYSYYYPPLLKRLICIMDLYSWNSIIHHSPRFPRDWTQKILVCVLHLRLADDGPAIAEILQDGIFLHREKKFSPGESVV